MIPLGIEELLEACAQKALEGGRGGGGGGCAPDDDDDDDDDEGRRWSDESTRPGWLGFKAGIGGKTLGGYVWNGVGGGSGGG